MNNTHKKQMGSKTRKCSSIVGRAHSRGGKGEVFECGLLKQYDIEHRHQSAIIRI